MLGWIVLYLMCRLKEFFMYLSPPESVVRNPSEPLSLYPLLRLCTPVTVPCLRIIRLRFRPSRIFIDR